MKRTICLIVLFMLGNLAWGTPTGSSSPVVAKQFKPVKTATKTTSKKSEACPSKGSTASVSPNIIPITTLNSSVHNDQGIPQHEPCTATRLTPTLLFTAAHCLLGAVDHDSRIHAEIFEAEDGTQGLIFSNTQRENSFTPNAQVFLYRSGYTQQNIPFHFDFAVVVLDSKLTFNSKFVRKTLEQAPLDFLPQATINEMESYALQKVQGEFAKQSAAYTKFIKKRLDAVSLLTMTPQGIVDELQGRQLSAYFWNGHPYDSTREQVCVFSGTIDPDLPPNSHTLVFEFLIYPGTSGSPLFDTQRKTIASVVSQGGFDENGDPVSTAGGLIDQAVCAWAKQHDRAVKCLVRHDGVVPNEQETTGKTVANVQSTPNPVAKKQKTPKGSAKH